VAPARLKGPSGVGTALTAVYSSQLGTGPMWLSMRLVHCFMPFALHDNIDHII
jgi:hypothetical protein